MTHEIFRDSHNKSFAVVDKKYGRISIVLKIISQEDFDDQLKVIQYLKECVEFVNDPKNNILPDYMLRLKIAPRRLLL